MCLSVVFLSEHLSKSPQGVTDPARLTADSYCFACFEKTTNRETAFSHMQCNHSSNTLPFKYLGLVALLSSPKLYLFDQNTLKTLIL